MAVSEELARAVRARARQRCQYCLIHEILQALPFISSTSFHGRRVGTRHWTTWRWRAPAAISTRRAKLWRLTSPLEFRCLCFTPVRQAWTEHFQFNGYPDRVFREVDVDRTSQDSRPHGHPRLTILRVTDDPAGQQWADSSAFLVGLMGRLTLERPEVADNFLFFGPSNSGVTEISFLCDNAIFQTATNAQVGRRASDFVQVGL